MYFWILIIWKQKPIWNHFKWYWLIFVTYLISKHVSWKNVCLIRSLCNPSPCYPTLIFISIWTLFSFILDFIILHWYIITLPIYVGLDGFHYIFKLFEISFYKEFLNYVTIKYITYTKYSSSWKKNGKLCGFFATDLVY